MQQNRMENQQRFHKKTSLATKVTFAVLAILFMLGIVVSGTGTEYSKSYAEMMCNMHKYDYSSESIVLKTMYCEK